MSSSTCYCGDLMIGSQCTNKNCNEDCEKRSVREQIAMTRRQELSDAGCPYPDAEGPGYSPIAGLQRTINALYLRIVALEQHTNNTDW